MILEKVIVSPLLPEKVQLFELSKRPCPPSNIYPLDNKGISHVQNLVPPLAAPHHLPPVRIPKLADEVQLFEPTSI